MNKASRPRGFVIAIAGICGKRGIQTPGTLRYAGFQDRCNRSLCHLSNYHCPSFKAVQNWFFFSNHPNFSPKYFRISPKRAAPKGRGPSIATDIRVSSLRISVHDKLHSILLLEYILNALGHILRCNSIQRLLPVGQLVATCGKPLAHS